MKLMRAQWTSVAEWLVRLCGFLVFIVGPFSFAYVVGGTLARVYQPLTDMWNLARLVFFVLVALLLGVLLALVLTGAVASLCWFLIRPFCSTAKRH